MSEELKTCPFCGGEARAFRCEESGTFDVQCQQCGAIPFIGSRTSEKKTMADVIAAWNARAAVTDEQFARAIHDGRAWQAVRECLMSPARGGGWYCSECSVWVAPGPMANATEHLAPRYCPNCGAKVVA